MRRLTTALMSVSVFALSALLATSAFAQNPGGSAEGKNLKNPVPSSPESIKAGQAVFHAVSANSAAQFVATLLDQNVEHVGTIVDAPGAFATVAKIPRHSKNKNSC